MSTKYFTDTILGESGIEPEIKIGRIRYPNGDRYIGCLSSLQSDGPNTRQGFGQMQFKDGTILQGEFKQNQLDGVALIAQPNQDLFFGHFEQNQRSGVGVSKTSDIVYRGSFDQNKVSGFGQQETPTAVSTGTFIDDYLNGFSKCYLKKDEDTYLGTFEDGVINGFGAKLGGNQYIGNYKEGREHGKGYKIYSDGSWYKGEYQDGKQYGFAEVETQAETRSGDLVDGQLEGLGMIDTANGDKIVGNFKNGELHGFGRSQTSSYFYMGDYEFGQENGVGLFIKPQSREQYIGDFKNGKMSGAGFLMIRDTIYQGGFLNNEHNGPGIYKYKQKPEVVSYFKDNIMVDDKPATREEVDQRFDYDVLVEKESEGKKIIEEITMNILEKIALNEKIPTSYTESFENEKEIFESKVDKLEKDVRDLGLMFRVKLNNFRRLASQQNINLFKWTDQSDNPGKLLKAALSNDKDSDTTRSNISEFEDEGEFDNVHQNQDFPVGQLLGPLFENIQQDIDQQRQKNQPSKVQETGGIVIEEDENEELNQIEDNASLEGQGNLNDTLSKGQKNIKELSSIENGPYLRKYKLNQKNKNKIKQMNGERIPKRENALSAEEKLILNPISDTDNNGHGQDNSQKEHISVNSEIQSQNNYIQSLEDGQEALVYFEEEQDSATPTTFEVVLLEAPSKKSPLKNQGKKKAKKRSTMEVRANKDIHMPVYSNKKPQKLLIQNMKKQRSGKKPSQSRAAKGTFKKLRQKRESIDPDYNSKLMDKKFENVNYWNDHPKKFVNTNFKDGIDTSCKRIRSGQIYEHPSHPGELNMRNTADFGNDSTKRIWNKLGVPVTPRETLELKNKPTSSKKKSIKKNRGKRIIVLDQINTEDLNSDQQSCLFGSSYQSNNDSVNPLITPLVIVQNKSVTVKRYKEYDSEQ